MKRVCLFGSSGSSDNEVELWHFIRKRDYKGSSKRVRGIMRFEKLLAQFPAAIWALVFSHLNDSHRLAVLPLVNKHFKKICRDPESWCSTSVDMGHKSFRMLFMSSKINFNQLRNIHYLCISHSLQRILKEKAVNMDNIQWKAQIILVESPMGRDVIQFLHRNNKNVKNLQFENADCHSKSLIPEIFSTPFEKLRSLSFNDHKITDCDLFVLQRFCPSLVRLSLGTSPTGVTRQGFDALSKCPKLVTLTLRASDEFRFSCLIRQLENLTFEKWNEKTISATTTVPWPTHQLKKLCLGEPLCKDWFFEAKHPICQFPQTIELTLTETFIITEKEFAYILKRNPKLEIMNLFGGCPLFLQQSTFDVLIQGNFSVLNFQVSNDLRLLELIIKTRKSLPLSHSLTVTGTKHKRFKKIIKFTFKKEMCNSTSLKWNPYTSESDFQLESDLLNQEPISIPDFLTIHDSTWKTVRDATQE